MSPPRVGRRERWGGMRAVSCRSSQVFPSALHTQHPLPIRDRVLAQAERRPLVLNRQGPISLRFKRLACAFGSNLPPILSEGRGWRTVRVLCPSHHSSYRGLLIASVQGSSCLWLRSPVLEELLADSFSLNIGLDAPEDVRGPLAFVCFHQVLGGR